MSADPAPKAAAAPAAAKAAAPADAKAAGAKKAAGPPACPKGQTCNAYDSKTIHYEEPFNGISAHETRIGHQEVTTQPKYIPTSIYPTTGPKTGFSQKGAEPAKKAAPATPPAPIN
jgi:hypothetical protein